MEKDLWNWAQYKSKNLGFTTASEYVFELIKMDRENDLVKKPSKRNQHMR